MENRTKNKIYLFTIGAVVLLVTAACLLWFNCRDYWISLIESNYDAILDFSLLYARKFAVIILLFLFFKLLQHVFIKQILRKIMQKIGSIERYNGITKIINFVLWTIFVFLAISTFIGDITALIASLGLVGFGLTFALQKPILNFVGWITIIFKDIYREGDRIKIGSVIGDVKEIQIMNTLVDGLLESSDVLSGKTISFPNEFILSTDVQNYTKDSNYIVNELSISITYESDYHKAMNILKGIIIDHVTKNKQKYIKKITHEKTQQNNQMRGWNTAGSASQEKMQTGNERDKQKEQNLESELKKLEEEFIPLIRIEMLDSAIQLIAQFKSPYNEIKKNRTEINIAFLDAVKQDPSIEIAYPHMQIVNNMRPEKKHIDNT